MITTIEDEDEIVRWAFAEIVDYLKQKHGLYWFRYHFKHWTVHKIMYNAFESAQIPVTRSWYRYGCFIHSTQLAGFDNFSSLKHRYLRSDYPPQRLRSRVEAMGFNVDSAIHKIHETIAAMPPKMDIYLKSLYEGAPKELGNIYLAKLELQKVLKQAEKIEFKNPLIFHDWLLKVRRNLSVFHMSAFSHDKFDDLSDVAMNFTSSVEEALLKIEELIFQRNKILKKWVNLIQEFSGFFDEQVWQLFALEISAMTVKGFREKQERIKQQAKKKEKIPKSLSELNTLSERLAANGLYLSWYEYRKRLDRFSVDRDIAQTISKMERIYEKSSEDE
jgi:hypothetical protein